MMPMLARAGKGLESVMSGPGSGQKTVRVFGGDVEVRVMPGTLAWGAVKQLANLMEPRGLLCKTGWQRARVLRNALGPLCQERACVLGVC